MSIITYDNAAIGGSSATNSFSIPFTVGSNPNTILLVAIYITPSATTFPSIPTIDGVSMSLVVENAGPTSSIGGLFVFALQNPPTGSQLISFTTGFDTTPKCWAVYSYYNVRGIDTSIAGQGTYASSFFSTSLTGTVNNSLMWAVATANESDGFFPGTSTGTNNVKTTSGTIVIGAGDFGVLPTPVNETASAGRNPGTGSSLITLVSLEGSQSFAQTATEAIANTDIVTPTPNKTLSDSTSHSDSFSYLIGTAHILVLLESIRNTLSFIPLLNGSKVFWLQIKRSAASIWTPTERSNL